MPPPADSAAILEESNLLARAGGGDREAFRLLYARFSAPLFSLALRIVGDRGEAEEMTQDAFVKIWRNAASYDARKSRPFTWAVTIMRRTCFDHLRKRRRIPVTTPLATEAGTAAGFPAGENLREAIEAQEDSGHLRRALAELPTGQRGALELALFSDKTHAEIASSLGQPIGTVKSWIRRGLVDLHTTLSSQLS